MDEFDQAAQRLQNIAFDLLKDWQRYRTALQMIAEGCSEPQILAKFVLENDNGENK